MNGNLKVIAIICGAFITMLVMCVSIIIGLQSSIMDGTRVDIQTMNQDIKSLLVIAAAEKAINLTQSERLKWLEERCLKREERLR